jgi:phage shock protein A
MGIFFRISDIFSANLNALLDRAENPEVMLDQMIREMEEGLARARRFAAVAIAAEGRLRRDCDDNREHAERWKARAREALAAGREEMARRALARKQEHDALARSLEEEYAEAVQASESARTALQALEARLAEARRKQRVLLARHRTAQVRIDVYRHLDFDRSHFGASLARFDRWAERLGRRVEELVAEAELHNLSGPETEFTDLDRRLTIDRELEALKRECEGEAEKGSPNTMTRTEE